MVPLRAPLRRHSGCRSLVLALSGCLVGVASGWSTVIDDFSAPQAALTAAGVTWQGAAVLGAERDLVVLGDTGSRRAEVTRGLLRWEHDAEANGGLSVTWDGLDEAAAVDAAGLGSVDLTAGGASAFLLGVVSNQAAAAATLTVHSEAGSSTVTINVLASPAPQFLRIPFNTLAGDAVFTSVGAIELALPASGAANTLELDFLRTTSTAAAAPADVTLTDIVLVDHDGDGRATPGDTLRYLATVRNTGATTLTNVGLTASAPAGTELAGAVAASPVARSEAPSGTSAPGDGWHTALNTPFTANVLGNDFAGAPAAGVIGFGGGGLGGSVDAHGAGTTATVDGHSVSLGTDGALSFTPAENFTGLFTFDYLLANGTGQSAASVTIAVGQRPVASNDSYSLTGNTRLDTSTGGLASLIANDEGDRLVVALGTPATGAAATLDSTSGHAVIDPAAGATGTTSFTYTITNGFGSTTGTVNLSIDEPVWFIDGSAVSPGDGRSFSPFNSLAAFNAANTGAAGRPGNSSLILLRNGNYAHNVGGGAIVLRLGQRLIGEGASGAITFAPGSIVAALSGVAPVISNSVGHGVALNSGNTVRGISIGDTPAGFGLQGASVGALVVQQVAKTGTGGGLQLAGTTAASSVTLTQLDSAGAPGAAIDLSNHAGTVVIAAGSITAPVGAAIQINGGAGNVAYAGSVTKNNAGRLLTVNGKSGGTVALSGSLAQSHANGTGVALTNNGGATIAFTGPVHLSTSGNAAFVASSSGTVSATAAGSTLATTTGTALSVQDTAIGSAGLRFQSIAANGAANPVYLSNTGTNGGLVVTGTGTTHSGGVIQNGTGHGYHLVNTANVSLASVRILNQGGSGIHAEGVAGLTLASSTLSNNGNTFDGTEANLWLNNPSGTVAIGDTTLQDSPEDQVRIAATTGTATVTFTNTTIGRTAAPNDGGNGLTLLPGGNASLTVNVTGSTFAYNYGAAILSGGDAAAAQGVTISASEFRDNYIGIDLAHGGTGAFTFDVAGNTLLRHEVEPLRIGTSDTTTTATQVTGRVRNNVVGNGVADSGSALGRGLSMDFRGGADAIVAVTGNTIRNTDYEGVYIQGRIDNPLSAQSGRLDLTFTGNTVATIDDNTAFPYGNVHGVNIDARNSWRFYLDISGNTSTSRGTGSHVFVRQRDQSVFNLERAPLGPVAAASAASFVAGQNVGGTTAAATAATSFTGVSAGQTRKVP